MSVETLDNIAALDAPRVSDMLADMRESHDALAELLDEVFGDLDSLGTEIELRSRLFDEVRAQSADQATELKTLRQAEADVRAELSATQREMERARQHLSELPSETGQLRDQLHAIELERCSLESELEALRVRTAELADHLSEVKRDAAEERAEWSSELKQFRRTLERQAELLADRLVDHTPGERPIAPLHGASVSRSAQETLVMSTIPAATPAAKDAVLGSVMAQFEMLQRDRQRRRTPS